MRPEQGRQLLRSLGLLEGEEEHAEPDNPAGPEFEGGPREPAPFTNPAEDHNAVVAQLLREDRWRRRGV